MFYVLLLLSDFIWKIFTIVCYKQRWILFRRVLMQLLYTRIERMMPFVSFYFLLFFASMFNECISVSVCVHNFHCFLPQQSDGLWCTSSLKLIAQTIQTHSSNCPIVCESTDFLMYTRWHINMSVCVWVTRDSWSFFSFVLRVCVITC